MCLLAQSGLRLEVLGNDAGSDGLVIKDLPELEIHEKQVEFTHVSTMVVVRSSLNKAGHKYCTFLPETDILTERKSVEFFEVHPTQEPFSTVNCYYYPHIAI